MTGDPFRTGMVERLKRVSTADSTAAAANALFGSFVDSHSESFEGVKENLRMADINVLYRTYVAEMFLFSIVGSLVAMGAGLFYVHRTGFELLRALRLGFGMPVAVGVIIFFLMYMYPKQVAESRRKDIEKNLPFAINHLSAISTSGIPPSNMFELLSRFDEYGGIATEAEKVSRRVNAFGEDFTTALREVADRSPSQDWKDILYGILSTVETGGSLEDFLKQKAEEELFEYRIEKEKEIERISTYASFYTAILIAAPVFLVTVFSVMNLLSAQIAGFSIRNLMWIGVHIIIPTINLMFLLFLGLKVN